jgi:hypothetical protein
LKASGHKSLSLTPVHDFIAVGWHMMIQIGLMDKTHDDNRGDDRD